MEFIELTREGELGRLRLRRPPLNILHAPMLRELLAALESAPPASVVLIEAAAECRAFSAGVDAAEHLPEKLDAMLESFHAVFRYLQRAEFLTLALVRGPCLGGGAELALACDAVIASDAASFGFPEIRLGCFPPVAAALLPSLVGLRRSLEWILSGREIGAAEALAAGLVNRVAPPELAEAEARAFLQPWLAHSAPVLRLARRAVGWRGFERRLRENEKLYREMLAHEPDMREGIEALLEKRPPHWHSAPPLVKTP